MTAPSLGAGSVEDSDWLAAHVASASTADRERDMSTVWLRAIECDHARSYGEAIFSTREKAEASLPHVSEWRPWGDNAWAEAGKRDFDDLWVIREMPFDPPPTEPSP